LIGIIASGVCLLASCFSGGPTIVHETWAHFTVGSYFGDGKTFGNWVERFTGYGHAAIVSDDQLNQALELGPRAPAKPSQTHGALVTSVATFGDFDATVQFATVRQLRRPTPNAWETGWLVWHYTDRSHFYYFVLEHGSWELGKEDPAYPKGQRFMATGSQSGLSPTKANVARIVQSGQTIFVYVNGLPVVRFLDDERPYMSGSFGLYCEDSIARFGLIHIAAPAAGAPS